MPAAGTRARRIILLVLLALAAGGIAYEAAGPAPINMTTGATIVATRKAAAVSLDVVGAKSTARTRPQRSAHASNQPLPLPGTPLVHSFDELKRRADAGDAEAATRLYHDLHRCIAVRRTRNLLSEVPHDDPGADVGVVDGHGVDIRKVREMTEYISSNSILCDDVTDAQLASFTPLMLQAAQLGDLKALDCYVGTDFDMMDGLLDHPEWIEQYRTQVPGLVESALQRGDWVVVELLDHAYGGAFNTSARGQVFGSDPLTHYRLLRLEQLGATGGFADKLAPMVVAAAKALSATQLDEAETWAGDYYARYFSSASNEVSNGANICQIDDD